MSVPKLESLSFLDRVESLREATKLAKAFSMIPKGELQSQAAFMTKIAILGNCSAQLIAELLFLMLLRHAIYAEIYLGKFDQWEVELLDPSSDLLSFNCQILLFLFYSETAQEIIERVLPTLLSFSNKKVKAFLVPFSSSVLNLQMILKQLKSLNSVQLVDISPVFDYLALNQNLGDNQSYWEEYRFPFHPKYTVFISRFLGSVIANSFTPFIKIVVTDLDDTLWKGTLAEDGVEGIVVDKSSRSLQKFLLGLRKNGTLLGLATANSQQDVEQAFQKRDDLELKLSDFSAVKCSFAPKYEAIESIARELHLTLSSICFLDNEPFQRNQVRSLLPEVVVPELPVRREAIVPYLKATGLFETRAQTEEDKKRASFYALEEKRKAFRSSVKTLDDYYKNLELVIFPEPISASNIKRVHQLLWRTNQFNLTTRRHEERTLLDYIADEKNYCTAFSLIDRYGEYGLVGVLIALPLSSASYKIDTWLLSCRALARTAEFAMFEHLLMWARKRKIKALLGEYLPTNKNAMVAELYPNLGFEKISDHNEGKLYRFLVEWKPKVSNEFVKVECRK